MTHEQLAARISTIVPDNYDVRELAKAVAKVLNDEYGSHTYDLFKQVLTLNLNNNGN
jgi:hypothetical protein